MTINVCVCVCVYKNFSGLYLLIIGEIFRKVSQYFLYNFSYLGIFFIQIVAIESQEMIQNSEISDIKIGTYCYTYTKSSQPNQGKNWLLNFWKELKKL